MERPQLLDEKREYLWLFGVLLLLLGLHLALRYQAYQQFTSTPFYFTHATVEQAYTKTKEGRTYRVLKLHSDEGWRFYTTTYNKRTLCGRRVRLQLFPSQNISFWDFLGTFYVKSRIKRVEEPTPTIKQKLVEKVNAQHSEPLLQRFYNAIFFATPLQKRDREAISQLGISHLVALSGFHLGILWGVVYGVLWLLYAPLQQRYFPYRFALIDVGVVALGLLGAYVWFVDAPDSLVRAYGMVFAGWLALVSGVSLLSFGLLAVVMGLLVVLFPSLLVSVGFWFSVAGVFYIYLLLYYTQHLSKWWVVLVVIPFGIFVLMLPVVHTIFPLSARCQLLSPLLSLLFTPFYPLVMVLHLVGEGGVLDGGLLKLFSLACETQERLLPWWGGVGYVLLSLGAVRQKRLFWLLLAVALGVALWLYI